MEINIKKLYENAIIPTRGSDEAAGYDLYAHLDSDKVELKPGETLMVGTGIALEIPTGYFGAIFARSGIAAKRNLRPADCVGVIDSDYRGEIKVPLYNDSNVNQSLDNKERVAQIVIMPYLNVTFNEVDTLSESNRDQGGFGSTGTK